MSLAAAPPADPFAALSHELRTPLTCVDGYIRFILEEETVDLDGDRRDCLEVVERNSIRLLHTARDLRFLAELDTGTLSWEADRVDVGALADQAVRAAAPSALRRGVGLRVVRPHLRPCLADGQLLAQLLDALVSNALKFTPEGGSVEMRLEPDVDRLLIEVEDDGAGIEEAAQPHVFERFYRAPIAVEGEVQGMGVGLTVAEAIVSHHGGWVGLASVLGEGTTVRVELPSGAAGSTLP